MLSPRLYDTGIHLNLDLPHQLLFFYRKKYLSLEIFFLNLDWWLLQL